MSSIWKPKFRSKIYFSRSTTILGLYNLIEVQRKFSKKDSRHYLDQQKKLLFVHNPKVAGNSIKRLLNLNPEAATHRTPSFLVSAKVWETYFSIVAVRHPIDRLISSYFYHTQQKYTGSYTKKYFALRELSFEEYFDLFVKEPFAIRPQVDYIRHYLSDKPADFIIRFESLNENIRELRKVLGLPDEGELLHLNAAKRTRNHEDFFRNGTFKKRVYAYYEEDFEVLGYARDQQLQRDNL